MKRTCMHLQGKQAGGHRASAPANLPHRALRLLPLPVRWQLISGLRASMRVELCPPEGRQWEGPSGAGG